VRTVTEAVRAVTEAVRAVTEAVRAVTEAVRAVAAACAALGGVDAQAILDSLDASFDRGAAYSGSEQDEEDEGEDAVHQSSGHSSSATRSW
jgi:hypothetical protein